MSSKTKAAAMKEEPMPALIPKLRFPEFSDAGEWTTRALGSLARISTEKVGDKSCIPMSITSGVGLVSQMDKFGRIIAGSSFANYLQLRKDDFAYNKSATKEYPEGFIALYTRDELAAVPNSIFTCFRIHGDSPVPQYLNYLFLGNLHGRWLRKFIEVGARAHGSLSIDEEDLLALPVPLPGGKTSGREQQKIAECLSSVDEVIATQARKLDALKIHKKGLMQQLFPREGETQPRLRFPEFRDAGEWAVRSVGQFAEVTTGAKDTQNKVEGGKYPFFVRSQSVERIDSYSYDGEAVLTSGDGVGVGKNFHHIDGKFDFHQRVYCIYNFDKGVSGLFFYLYFSEHFGERVMRMSAKNSVDSVRMAMITEMPILLPSLSEQRRIAICLSVLDDLIAAEAEKLEALETHKRGLMQQLFPSREEVEA
jgi:type I restriction enzyme, S subunit